MGNRIPATDFTGKPYTYFGEQVYLDAELEDGSLDVYIGKRAIATIYPSNPRIDGSSLVTNWFVGGDGFTATTLGGLLDYICETQPGTVVQQNREQKHLADEKQDWSQFVPKAVKDEVDAMSFEQLVILHSAIGELIEHSDIFRGAVFDYLGGIHWANLTSYIENRKFTFTQVKELYGS